MLGGLGDRHFTIAMELITWYCQHGVNNLDFMDTARSCEVAALEAGQQKAYDNCE